MNAEVYPLLSNGEVLPDDARAVAINLEMHSSRKIHYSIVHTDRPVFDPTETTLADIVAGRPVLMVVDRNVDAMYGAALRAYADRHLTVVSLLIIDGDESNKTWVQAEEICRAAMESGLGRAGVIVAIGGGVVLDISGFAASIYRRGIAYLRIPTTLIGQVDVSVGVKQGVNVGRYKNVLGSFYPPIASINDASLLASLPPVHLAAGFAEVIKMAVITDCLLFDLVERYGAELLASGFQSPASQARAIMLRSEASMLRELQSNLFETDLKRLVDFGHTFSVALESDSDFQIPHGIAVGHDMLISTGIAVQRGICPEAILDRLLRLYRVLGLPLSQDICTADRLQHSLAAVRAHRGGALNLVVPLRIGQPTFLQEVSDDELHGTLSRLQDAHACHGWPGI